MTLFLNGTWKVTHRPYQADIQDILAENFVPEGWLNANVPEEIHATLRRAGAIRGNTYDKREDEERWIEEKDWIYCKKFFVPATEKTKSATLLFEGLDTFCEIYLNGEKLGDHQNMHTACRLEAAPRLRWGGQNTLVIRFFSPVAFVAGEDQSEIFSITTSERIFARKAQMNYSWDFCARCVTVGIWKPVSLIPHKTPEIDNYYLYTDSLKDGQAALGLETELRCFPGVQAEGCTVRACLSDGETEVWNWEGSPEEAKKVSFTVSHPRLWWPRPYGEAFLYQFRLQLWQNGRCVDERAQRFGIRTIEVLQERQEDGKSFQFSVNGKPLFLRGANWVPINTVYTDITRRDYEILLHDAAHGNLSMLRIWGGGIYEDPAFFELCDQHGILVWSDFMLACGIYPQTEAFLSAMAQEADEVLKTYRNCTSIALWSGDNENGQAYGWAGRPYEFESDRISNQVLKEACARLDPRRYYLPTSPASPDPDFRGGDNPSSPYQGDLHLYIMSGDPGVTANRDYGKEYYKRVLGFRPRFMSEFGFISLPEKDSYYRFNVRREPLRNPSEIIRFLPSTKQMLDEGHIEDVIHYSQLFNSMALKFWIEHFRSLKGVCAGSLYWKFNDPLADCPDVWMYPSHMCAVDMYLRPKMTYYYTRRAYDDVLVMLEEESGGWQAVICNETDRPIVGTLRIEHRTFHGDLLWSREQAVFCGADAAVHLGHVAKDELPVHDPAAEYLRVILTADGQVYDNRYFFLDVNELHRLVLEPAGLRIVRTARQGDRLQVELRAEHYARCVRLNILDMRADYSDNYFDLDAGSSRVITIDLQESSEPLFALTLYAEGENVERLCLPLSDIPEEKL